MVFQTGDRVVLTYETHTVDGTVTLASENGRSLIVAFEAIVAGYAGAMPIFQREDGTYVDLFRNRPLTLEPITP